MTELNILKCLIKTTLDFGTAVFKTKFLPALCLALSFGLSPSAQASHELTEVDVELVLAVDVSYSMDEEEQTIQRAGYVEALQSPEVLKAIHMGLTGRIAVIYLEWGGVDEHFIVADWQMIATAEDAALFAARIEQAPLRRLNHTSISGALEASRQLMNSNTYEGLRKVIDISGDGRNNHGPAVGLARMQVLSEGIVVNGLPLMMRASFYNNVSTHKPMIDTYYEQCVIGGPGSFAIPVLSMQDFAGAIRTKLVLEIAGLTPYPPARIQPARALAPVQCDDRQTAALKQY
jgi:hypothetical protein